MPGLDDALERIQGFLESRLPGFLDAPGAVLGLTDRERLLGVIPAGRADAFTGAPMEEHTRSEIGSISKSFAAVVALQEVEKATLDLHAPVTDYVPWFEVRTQYGPITTHHLLTHTSGLIMGMDFADDAIPAVESLRRTSTGFAPGERFLYSNDAYKLVGLILETVTGSTIRKLLRERIFEPVGMRDSDPAITYETRTNLATGHQRISEDRPPHRGIPLVAATPIISTTADGSIISTAADMAAYVRMLLNRSDAGDGERLLEESSFAMFTRPAIEIADEPGVSYAYGLDVFEIDGRAHIGHSGGMVGYYALLECDLDTGVGAVMLVNGLAERKEVIRFALSVLRAWKQEEPLPEIPAPRDPELVKEAARIAGRYRSGEREVALAARNGKVMFASDGIEVALVPDEDARDRFVVPHPAFDRFHLKVERNENEVVALTNGPDRFVREGHASDAASDAPSEWEAFSGHYRTYNPWGPGFRVYSRRGRLLLSRLDGEYELEPLDDEAFRVGESWSADRVRFDTIVEGRPHQAVYNGHLYWRSFVE